MVVDQLGLAHPLTRLEEEQSCDCVSSVVRLCKRTVGEGMRGGDSGPVRPMPRAARPDQLQLLRQAASTHSP